MFFRVVLILAVIALAYVGFELVRFHHLYQTVQNPQAAFQSMGPEDADFVLVEFYDYRCNNCQDVYGAVKELSTLRPDIRIVARPVAFVDERSEEITRLVLAAGRKGYFWEFHEALLEYPGVDYPETLFQELAMLYGLDYAALTADSQSEEVTALLEENREAARKLGVFSVPAFLAGRLYHELQATKGYSVNDLLRLITQAEKGE